VSETPVVSQTLLLSGSVEYPVLKKLGKQNIRQFLVDRPSYVREMEERNKRAGQANGTPVSLSFAVDATLLASLVDLRRLGPHIDC
jgi:hypothetical protein